MRHLKRTAKLGRTGQHRNAMLANLVTSLILHKRITTTLAKAKAARSVAEKMVTLGKRASIHDRRIASARLRVRGQGNDLHKPDRKAWRSQKDVIRILFDEIAPSFKARQGGYTRVIRTHQRKGDAAQIAILEWVDAKTVPESVPERDAVGTANQPAAKSESET